MEQRFLLGDQMSDPAEQSATVHIGSFGYVGVRIALGALSWGEPRFYPDIEYRDIMSLGGYIAEITEDDLKMHQVRKRRSWDWRAPATTKSIDDYYMAFP
jgi:hypothetical protein